ncbi:MAG TPA: hypothetical protein VFK65_08460 [Candidatus Binatia bacterium]|nr:hypothetical protein [Candidatus Binatia bacterium]
MFKPIALAIFLLPIFSACGFAPANLTSKQSSDLEGRRIRRIAVLPPVITAAAPVPSVPFSAAPVARTSERDAAESLARLVHTAMVALPNWQVVSESEVREAVVNVPASSEEVRLKSVGEMVYADAVMMGRMQRYRERVGDEWGAKSPASVAFILDLVDVRRGDIVWSARFDETQKPLSESIFSLGDIGERGLRWLTAEQLTQEGVKKAIGQLHEILTRRPAS